MSERPTDVRVGHVRFTIRWVQDKSWLKEDDESGGTMEGHKSLIRIRLQKDVDEQHYRQTLQHEIFHAVFFVTQLTNEDPRTFEDWEETVVRTMSLTLIAVWQDNPHVVEYLCAGTLSAGG